MDRNDAGNLQKTALDLNGGSVRGAHANEPPSLPRISEQFGIALSCIIIAGLLARGAPPPPKLGETMAFGGGGFAGYSSCI